MFLICQWSAVSACSLQLSIMLRGMLLRLHYEVLLYIAEKDKLLSGLIYRKVPCDIGSFPNVSIYLNRSFDYEKL